MRTVTQRTSLARMASKIWILYLIKQPKYRQECLVSFFCDQCRCRFLTPRAVLFSLQIQVSTKQDGLQHGGSKTQVTGQVRSGQEEEYFSAEEIDYIFGVFGFINGVDNVNWSPYRDFGGVQVIYPWDCIMLQ